MLVLTALLNEDDLIDPGLSKLVEMCGDLGRCPDTTPPPHFGQSVAGLLETLPEVRLSGCMLTEDVVMAKRIAKVPEAIAATPLGLLSIMMHGKTRHHGNVGVDRMTDR